MNNPIQKNNFFSTPATMNELVDYVLGIPNDQQRQVAITVMAMTWNMASELVEQAITERQKEVDGQ